MGAGGPLGMAWTVGALAALEEHLDWDARDADLIVGTSAGAVLGAMLRCGVSASSLYRAQLPSAARALADPSSLVAHHVHNRPSVGRPGRFPGSVPLAARALLAPWRHGPWSMAAGLLPRGRRPVTAVQQVLDGFPAMAQPMRPADRTLFVAMDYRTGRRVAFGDDGAPAATWAEAVGASIAFPGWFSPAVLNGRRYVDGGLASPCSADLALRAEIAEVVDEVWVLAPLAMTDRVSLARWSPSGAFDHGARLLTSRSLGRELRALDKAGVDAVALAPDPETRRLMGANPMRTAFATQVTAHAYEHTSTRLATGLDRLRARAA